MSLPPGRTRRPLALPSTLTFGDLQDVRGDAAPARSDGTEGSSQRHRRDSDDRANDETDGFGSSEPPAGSAEPPRDAGSISDDGNGNRPAMEYTFKVPNEDPGTTQGRNQVARRAAEWLRTAAAVGAIFAETPQVRAVWLAIEAAAWLAEKLPSILSYLDEPKTLQELQDAVDDPQPGYEIHHIVERQRWSKYPEKNYERFRDHIDSRENLVRIPYWKHVEISSWYSSKSEAYGGLRPRAYLRGREWDEQYRLGLDKLRDFGVLK